MRRLRPTVISLAVCTMTVLSACAVGPDPGPDAVTGGGDGANTTTSPSAEQTKLPTLPAPNRDLTWTACGDRVASTYDTRIPDGVRLDCAELPVPLDPERPDGDSISVAVTRASVASTPPKAPPVVLTAGTDMPSSRALLVLAGSAGRTLLDKHPVVAVDRRGIPRSSAVDCMTRLERTTLLRGGLPDGPGSASMNARIDRMARAASSASDGCTETLEPNQLDFGLSGAAADLEALRIAWQLDRMAVLGVGEGSDVALAYSSNYAGRVGRLILDTPTAFGAKSRDRAAQQADAIQNSLRTFGQRCSTLGSCPLGADPTATIGAVLERARDGRLGELSDSEALSAITTGIAVIDDDPKAVTALAGVIAAAAGGEDGGLTRLAARANSLRDTDGQQVARCNDVRGPVGQNEIGNLVTAWSKQNPLSGADRALSLLRCNAWAPAAEVNPPNALPVNPLIVTASGDPINGVGGREALGATFIKAGVQPTTVTWDGLGYSAAGRSGCVADLISRYLTDEPLSGPTDRGCPS